LFVDSKGIVNADYQYRIDDYQAIFREHNTGALRVFPDNGMDVRVALSMYNQDASALPQRYSEYCYDSPKGILKQLVSLQPEPDSG
jgi:hypothetical protein